MPSLNDPALSDDILRKAVACIQRGDVLLYPTDTVYGLGGDASIGTATARIRRLKGGEPDRPVLVLTDTWERVGGWIVQQQGLVSDLMSIASVHPMTILFPATALVPEGLIGKSTELGVRLCRHPFCVQLIQESGKLISSTSANLAGLPPPVRFTDIDEAILRGSDFAVDGGILSGKPSTIVRPEGVRLNVLREGSLPRDELMRLLS